MAKAVRQFRDLRRLFFGRFLDNDLISLEGDASSLLASVLGVLAAPGVFLPFLEFLRFSSVPLCFQPWDMRDLAALPDKALYLGLSMTVIGVVTVFEWEALLLDRRDIGVLRPLPISLRTLLAAKVAALIQFWLVFCVVVSALPAVLAPMVILQHSDLGLLLRFIGSHAASVLAVNAFVFLVVVGVQSILLLALGYRLYRRVSPWVQGGLLALLLGGFFLGLALPFDLETMGGSAELLRALPQIWFLGLYQSLLGWPHEVFHELAARGLVALAGAGSAATAAYALSYRRIVARSFEALDAPPNARQAIRFWRVDKWLLRTPSQRASFHFVMTTLKRSRTHRMLVLGWMGGGLALVLQGLTGAVAAGVPNWWSRTDGPLLPAAAILWLSLVGGLRYAFTVPAELRANWVFQTAGALDVHELMVGVRKAVLLMAVPAMAVVLMPIHALAWGWTPAVRHVAFNAAVAWVLVECSLAGFEKLPFSCSYVAGKADLKSRWFLYLMGYLVYIAAVTAAGRWTMGGWGRLAVALTLAGVAANKLNEWRRRTDGSMMLEFNERPEPAVRTLELA